MPYNWESSFPRKRCSFLIDRKYQDIHPVLVKCRFDVLVKPINLFHYLKVLFRIVAFRFQGPCQQSLTLRNI